MHIERELIETFFDQMSSAAYIKDEKLRFVYVNSAYADFCGLRRERLLGKTSFQITNTVATKLLEKDEAKVLASGTSSRIGDRATSFSGKTVWREVERQAIETSTGEKFLAVTMKDISSQKDLEYRLKDKQSELSVIRELAASSEQSKTDEQSKINHQLRLSLRAISNLAANGLMKEEGSAKSSLELIQSSVKSALAMLDEFSDQTSENAISEVNQTKFDLFELMNELSAATISDAHKKGLKFSTFIDPDIPSELSGDANKIRQIIINLIDNAINLTNSGEINIDVQLAKRNDGQAMPIKFEVRGSGKAIAESLTEDILSGVSPSDGAFSAINKDQYDSLVISRELVHLMDGKIGSDNETQDSSSYWFELKFDAPDRIKLPTRKEPNLSGQRFIIIDSDEFDRALLENQLAEWNGDVAACSHVDEAIAVMCALFEKNLAVDGIFLDEATNRTGEFDLYDALTSDEMLSRMPILLMSTPENAEGKTIEGELILKPLDIISLKTQIARLFTENEQEQELEDIISDRIAKKNGEFDQNDDGFKKLVGGVAEVENIDILIFEQNTVNQIMLAQVLDAAKYNFKIVSELDRGEELFKRCSPKVVLLDTTNKEFDNENAKVVFEKLRRYNSLVPFIGLVSEKFEDNIDEPDTVLSSVIDGHISKPISPAELFNNVERWMEIAKVSDVRMA